MKSDSAAETKARSTEDWREYLFKYQDVCMRFFTLKHQMIWLQQELNAWQTKCANNRREVKAYES